MTLKIGNFHVKEIQFGDSTNFLNGVLTVNKEEAISIIGKDGSLKNIDLKIARPGESIRMLPVKAVVEPRIRPDGRATFPGHTGTTKMAGEGILHALKNICITAVGMETAFGNNGIIDMAGEGAKHSPYSKLINLVFIAENANSDEDDMRFDNKNFTKIALDFAEYIATAVKEQEPEEWECYELNDVSDKNLPRVAFINQYCNFRGWLKDMTYYGYDLEGVPTTVVNPLEYFDGALANIGNGGIPANAVRTTYDMQNAPIIKRLISEHGKTINFIGALLVGHVETIDEKQKYATMIVSAAKTMKCDAVISLESHCGNVDVDYMMTIAGLEDAGIKTVGILAENNGRDNKNPGKTFMDSKANAIVSTGNTCEVYELPALDTVYGKLQTVATDPYWGAWKEDAVYGPSLREDGSLIIDAHMFMGHDGLLGSSTKIVKDF